MFYTNKILLPLFIVAGLLCSCSQDQIEDADAIASSKATQGETTVKFLLQSNVSSSTRSAEDSYSYDKGTQDEYKVNTVTVYLFDNPTKLFVKSFVLSNLKPYPNSADKVIYETEEVTVPQGTYDIFVTANTNRVIKKEKESDFLADIDSATYKRALVTDISQGVVMTNRGADNEAVVIANKEDETTNVINITLERVLARLDIAKASDSFELTDKANQKYATVKLDGYYIVNVPKYYYSYRHTAVLTSMEIPQWSLQTNFGDINDVNGYVIDPYFFNKKIDASNFTNADKYYENFYGDVSDPNSIQWSSFNPARVTPDYKTAYCLENCTLAPAQKNGYSTGVVFRAIMEPNNNVYRLNTSGSLERVSDPSLYPEVLYYHQYRFYTSTEAVLADMNSQSSPYQAQKFEKTNDGYRCYYNYWIRHLDNNKPTEMGVMEFGIVRNNLYRMLVSNVSDLGTGVPIPNPDTPDEGETHLKVVLNVKPWIVRDLTNIVL